MRDLIADAYVVLWKHFERQSSHDERFLTFATFGGSVFLIFVNVCTAALVALGKDSLITSALPKNGGPIAAVVLIILSIAGSKLYVARHPDLQTSAGISNRYSRLLPRRRAVVVSLIFGNLGLFLLINAVRAILMTAASKP